VPCHSLTQKLTTATSLGCDVVFDSQLIANLLQSTSVKKIENTSVFDVLMIKT